MMTPQEFSAKFTAIGLEGWLDIEDIEIISKEVAKLEAGQIYFEVGVAYGKSMATAALSAKDGVEIWGVDILDWDQRKNHHRELGIAGRVNFIHGDSQETALHWKRPIDVLFIDGSHQYLGVLKDIASWLPYVKHGGRILFHDYDRPTSPGVARAIDEFVRYSDLYTDKNVVRSMFSCTKI